MLQHGLILAADAARPRRLRVLTSRIMDLLDAAKALRDLIYQMDPAEWSDFLAYSAPETQQLARAISLTEECIRSTGEVSHELGS